METIHGAFIVIKQEEATHAGIFSSIARDIMWVGNSKASSSQVPDADCLLSFGIGGN